MRKIVILGAAESGVGAAILAQKQGFDVFVSDKSMIKPHYKDMLDSHHIEWEEGRHSEERILMADEVVKSPGIPKEVPMVRKIVERGIPVVSEIEFAGRYTDAKMVCITGSNGKTTTTSLTYHIFREAGLDVGQAVVASGGTLLLDAYHAWVQCQVVDHHQHRRVAQYHARPPRPLRLQLRQVCGCKDAHPAEPDP